jgi:hypothetical protein
VQGACQFQSPRNKSLQPRVLLAFDHLQRLQNRRNVPSLSEVLTQLHSSIPTIITHHTFVAAVEMGHRHRGTSDNYTEKLQVCSGCNQVLHKVGRAEVSSQHSRSGAQRVLLAEHNIPF